MNGRVNMRQVAMPSFQPVSLFRGHTNKSKKYPSQKRESNNKNGHQLGRKSRIQCPRKNMKKRRRRMTWAYIWLIEDMWHIETEDSKTGRRVYALSRHLHQG
jgi:hypothetical protein